MVQAGVRREVVEGTGGAGFRVGGGVDETAYAGGMESTGAHWARFEGDVEGTAGEAPAPELSGGAAEGEHLGVSSRVFGCFTFVVGCRQDLLSPGDHGADGDFALLGSSRGLLESAAHHREIPRGVSCGFGIRLARAGVSGLVPSVWFKFFGHDADNNNATRYDQYAATASALYRVARSVHIFVLWRENVQRSGIGSLVEVQEIYGRLRSSIRTVIVGKDRVVDLCLISLFAGGHVLLTDIPGVGKTTLAKAISSSIAAEFSRIQFTPDLLPSDITGTSIYDPREARFKWLPGPVFASVLLADEINRATPRTQSALLEAMAEGQVTVENETRALPEPFFVVATQNPHQFHGTYPLPEGQLDRFMVATTMGYPERMAELGIVRAQVERRPLEEIEPVVGIEEVALARELVKKVQVHEEVLGYAVALAEATRNHPVVSLGVSPRGSIALIRAAQARAATCGRDFVGPEDIKELAPDTLPHRLSVRGGTSGATAEAVIGEVLKSVPSPA